MSNRATASTLRAARRAISVSPACPTAVSQPRMPTASSGCGDLPPALESARDLAGRGQVEQAIAEFDKATAARPDDARLSIERGRFLAGLGRETEADADFKRAALRAPQSPQLFLDAGWWVAGPYAPDFANPALENDPSPDPSKPPPPAGDEPRHWRTVPTHHWGRVELDKVFHAENIAAYALAIVYSTTRQDVVLLAGADDSARIWHNGKLVLDSPRATEPGHYFVAATLEPGRNLFFAKVVNGPLYYTLHLRFSAQPADFARAFAHLKKWPQAAEAYARAIASDAGNRDPEFHRQGGLALAELGRSKEAAAAFERALAAEPGSFDKQRLLAHCYVALHDLKSCRQLCESAIKQHVKTQDRNLANHLVRQIAMIPSAVHNYSDVLELGKKLMDIPATGGVYFNTYGAILYRAGKYPSAIGFLQRSIDARKGKGNAFDWVFLAMARHKSRQPGDREALDQARMLSKTESLGWVERIELGALLEEAGIELELPPPPI